MSPSTGVFPGLRAGDSAVFSSAAVTASTYPLMNTPPSASGRPMCNRCFARAACGTLFPEASTARRFAWRISSRSQCRTISMWEFCALSIACLRSSCGPGWAFTLKCSSSRSMTACTCCATGVVLNIPLRRASAASFSAFSCDKRCSSSRATASRAAASWSSKIPSPSCFSALRMAFASKTSGAAGTGSVKGVNSSRPFLSRACASAPEMPSRPVR